MQKDFHFYCIAVLARRAGFRAPDAFTIAYASQYVDDSTESEPIQIGDIRFDPVRSAHFGLRSFEWGTQKKIFIPFHFMPPKLPIHSGDDTYVTEPGSNTAREVLRQAKKEKWPFCLYRVGIALHAYADTWAHQHFSGRQDPENDVEKICHRRKDKWKRLLLENAYLDLLPQIGHAEAGKFPDYPYLEWKYTGHETGKGKEVLRDNPGEFLKAAKAIFRELASIKKPYKSGVRKWGQIKGEIEGALKFADDDLDKRCKNWRNGFSGLFPKGMYKFNHFQWRKEALRPKKVKDIDWDRFSPGEFSKLRFRPVDNFFETSWVMFHRAALRQRHFVLENLY